jgi:hypothetical protein
MAAADPSPALSIQRRLTGVARSFCISDSVSVSRRARSLLIMASPLRDRWAELSLGDWWEIPATAGKRVGYRFASAGPSCSK